jgi:hypothetical protein
MQVTSTLYDGYDEQAITLAVMQAIQLSASDTPNLMSKLPYRAIVALSQVADLYPVIIWF